jgi:hypothetical protein
MRGFKILSLAMLPLLLAATTSLVAFEKKVTLSECFTATW